MDVAILAYVVTKIEAITTSLAFNNSLCIFEISNVCRLLTRGACTLVINNRQSFRNGKVIKGLPVEALLLYNKEKPENLNM